VAVGGRALSVEAADSSEATLLKGAPNAVKYFLCPRQDGNGDRLQPVLQLLAIDQHVSEREAGRCLAVWSDGMLFTCVIINRAAVQQLKSAQVNSLIQVFDWRRVVYNRGIMVVIEDLTFVATYPEPIGQLVQATMLYAALPPVDSGRCS
jgi:hypothetical protein